MKLSQYIFTLNLTEPKHTQKLMSYAKSSSVTTNSVGTQTSVEMPLSKLKQTRSAASNN